MDDSRGELRLLKPCFSYAAPIVINILWASIFVLLSPSAVVDRGRFPALRRGPTASQRGCWRRGLRHLWPDGSARDETGETWTERE